MSTSSWLEGLLTVAVLGGDVEVEMGAELTTLLLVWVVLVQLAADMRVCSSLGCFLANSVMLKTNWRQPSLI